MCCPVNKRPRQARASGASCPAARAKTLSHTPVSIRACVAPTGTDQAQRLMRRYHALRAELQSLMAQSVRDLPRIDQLVDALEQVQLQLKAAQGLQGNNPNE